MPPLPQPSRPQSPAARRNGAGQPPAPRRDEARDVISVSEVHVVPIDELTPDPVNARLHPERNLEAIKASLRRYGQRKPLVVNRRTGVVEAGNGTLAAARALGWTRLAVSYVDDDPVTAAGYGLADNRSAELAQWDFEVVARLDKLLAAEEGGDAMIGWSDRDLDDIRDADWTPPPPPTGDGGSGRGRAGAGRAGRDPGERTVEFGAGTWALLGEVADALAADRGDGERPEPAAAVEEVCRDWLAARAGIFEESEES